MRETTYRPEIDGLRAVSIVAVVLFHAGFSGASGGFVGVDVFFVISGYLITGFLLAEKAETGRISLLRFYERRVRRILPALYVMASVVGVVCLFVYAPADLARFAGSLASMAVFASNVYFWRSAGYFHDEAEIAPLLHTWSLSVEEQFYLVWPLFVLLFAGRFRRWLGPLAAAALVASFAIAEFGSVNYPQPTFYLMPGRAFELMLGAMLALPGAPRARPGWRAEGVVVAGLAAILASVALLDPGVRFPGLYALPPCLGAAAVIWAGRESRLAALLLANRPAVFVGLVSYSWYLWHWPALALWRYVTFWPPTPQAAVPIVAASFVLAVLSWRYVERPFRRPLGREVAPRARWRAIAALGVAPGVALVLAGVGLRAADGLPWRVSPEVLRLTEQVESVSPIRRACHLVPRRGGALPPESPCVAGAGADYTAILWGDSHAAQYAPTLTRLGQREGFAFRQMSKSGCAPLTDVAFVPEPPVFAGDCARFNDEVLRLLAERPGITDVWIAAFWALDLDWLGGDRDALAARLAATVERLRGMGRRVRVFGVAPNYPYDAGGCAVRAALGAAFAIRCGAALADLRETVLLDAALHAAAGPAYVPLLPRLCPEGYCGATVDGVAVYGDGHHLNAMFAARLADWIE